MPDDCTARQAGGGVCVCVDADVPSPACIAYVCAIRVARLTSWVPYPSNGMVVSLDPAGGPKDLSSRGTQCRCVHEGGAPKPGGRTTTYCGRV